MPRFIGQNSGAKSAGERGEGEWDEQGKGEEGENMSKRMDESSSSSQLMKQ